jgi:hypothetical protein
MREYITSLGSRSKWFIKKENVKEGDMVLVIEPGTPRRQWRLGKIERVYPGADGSVRVVDVKVGDKIYRRSIGCVSPLEFQTD